MIELDKIYPCDVLQGLGQLEDESIDLIITSPPYNKTGLNGIYNIGEKMPRTINYVGDPNNDNLPEDEYENWQLEILSECYRVLKKDGSLFYNHKNRIWRGRGEIITPYKWILNSPFKIRQEIIWNRKNGPNQDPSRYVPAYENIYWLTKNKKIRYRRKKDALFQTDVWTLTADRHNEHPAPFPIEIPDNIIPCIQEGEGHKDIIVLDPFMGSGTVAVSAKKNGAHYIGFEKFQEYVDMANKRIEDYDNDNKDN